MNIEVKPTEDGKFGLYVNGNLIGSSKAQFDADFGKQVLLKAIQPLKDAALRASFIEFPDTTGGRIQSTGAALGRWDNEHCYRHNDSQRRATREIRSLLHSSPRIAFLAGVAQLHELRQNSGGEEFVAQIHAGHVQLGDGRRPIRRKLGLDNIPCDV